MNAAIAQHLNVLESAIVRIEEWASVLFVVVRGVGARFVSKKVGQMGELKLDSSKRAVRKYEEAVKRVGRDAATKSLKRFVESAQNDLNKPSAISQLTAQSRKDMANDIQVINQILGL